jgi:2-polyprenyl-6-hydroxyphenyl methylase/3-demethylubiquinone-9 3-methyltransferase
MVSAIAPIAVTSGQKSMTTPTRHRPVPAPGSRGVQEARQASANPASTEDSVRFEFGRNWADFSQLIDDARIVEAQSKLVSLLGHDSLVGKSFLDIGCGSGIHALAALRLGASPLLAIDIDSESVRTTAKVLEKFWNGGGYTVRQQSVFNLDPRGPDMFDVVYSWGVLHHTGDMRRAIGKAAAMVKPGGQLALALYGKTRYCNLWRKIKRWYVHATPEQQRRAERAYVRLFGAYLLLRGKRLSTHRATYEKKRGMDFMHDVRDWIGGYPYESIDAGELRAIVEPLGFTLVRQNVQRRSGLFGSGNDEYIFIKSTAGGS